MGGKGRGYHGHSREHGLHSKGIKTKSKRFNTKPIPRIVANGNIELPQNIIDIAKEELINSKHNYDVITSAQGVVVGSQTNMDSHFDKAKQSWRWDADEMYDSFTKTRKALSDKYGSHITLYRFQGNESIIKNKHTLNWVHSDSMREAFSKMFKDYEEFGDYRELIKKEVPIKDIIALNVGEHGRYEEFIVFNHNSEGIVYPSNYGVI